VVVALKEGVVKLLVVTAVALVCTKLPPVAASYHLKVPATGLLAASVTVPVPQVAPAVVVGAAGTALMVATTDLRGVLSQLAALLNVT
jgi:hypothetical protein